MLKYISNAGKRADYVTDGRLDWESERSDASAALCPLALAGGRALVCARAHCEWWMDDRYALPGACAVRKLAESARAMEVVACS